MPRFHLMSMADSIGWRFSTALPRDLRQPLQALCRKVPAAGLGDEPVIATEARALLSDGATSVDAVKDAVWQGPVYGFPDVPTASQSITVVPIRIENAQLLRPGMSDWLPDVAHRSPFVAAIVDDQAVAVCASVRIGQHVHEAGVETQPAYRGRGFARAAVSAWADAVRKLGARPVYSTSRDNAASQGVAHSLGLQLIGSDFHIR